MASQICPGPPDPTKGPLSEECRVLGLYDTPSLLASPLSPPTYAIPFNSTGTWEGAVDTGVTVVVQEPQHGRTPAMTSRPFPIKTTTRRPEGPSSLPHC